jgi:hypothetical protein
MIQLGLTAEQLAERKLGIGGSDAGRISRQLWLEKTGRAEEEDLSNVLAVQMGSFTEPLNAHWYTKTTGREIAHRGNAVVSDKYPWMRANLDGITTTSMGQYAYWDAKHVGKADQAMLLRYTPQMTHCCVILGLDHWVLSVFVGNGKHEIFEQEVDPVYASRLIKRERDFWENYVVPDIDPGDRFEEKVVPPPPAPKLREIVVPDPAVAAFGELLRRENWLPEMLTEVAAFASTHGAAIKHAIVREHIKAIVPDDIGLVRYGLFTYKRDGRGVTLSLAKGDEE